MAHEPLLVTDCIPCADRLVVPVNFSYAKGDTFALVRFLVTNTCTFAVHGGGQDDLELVYYDDKNQRVTGGTFNMDVSQYVSSGYEILNNGDGTYTVRREKKRFPRSSHGAVPASAA